MTGCPLGAVGEEQKRGLEAGTAMTGRGPVALPGGLLIMTGGDGGKGVKLVDWQTTVLEAGAGGKAVGAG